MAIDTTSDFETPLQRPKDVAWLQGRILHVVLFCTILASPFVFIEPSPYEGMMALLIVSSLVGGAVLDRKHVPLIILLAIWNAGLLLALLPVTDDSKAVIYTGISIYLALNAVVYASLATTNSEERLATIRNAYILAALIASALGILGYFHILAPDLLVREERASSTFKDPNVFGPFLILPLLFLIQLMIYRGAFLRYLVAIGVIVVGLFLSFSRGAWGNFVESAVIMLGLMFITTPDGRFRARIASFSIMCGVGGAVLIGALLSIRAVVTLFQQRAELLQSYDVGSGGRFTTQLRAFHKMFDFPNGLGPLQYAKYFGIDPHNDYLNAFYSNGWIGGVAYPTLVIVTLLVGFRALLVRTPWQPYLIAVFAAYCGGVCEGAIVGTEHWRHYYLLLGLVWGLSVATENARRSAMSHRW
jgi:hypothetical protein